MNMQTILESYICNKRCLNLIRDYLVPMKCTITGPTLIMGMGGGNDIFTCLPWYLWLTEEEQNACVLANYSFTDDLYKYEILNNIFLNKKLINQWVIPVTPSIMRTKRNKDYFPEADLAKSLNKTIYT